MEIELVKLNNAKSFLLMLAALGREAERCLNVSRERRKLGWHTLLAAFVATQRKKVPTASLPDYTRWLRVLGGWATEHGVKEPGDLYEADAHHAMSDLFGGKRSAVRVARFYRRVWSSLGFNSEIWQPDETSSDERGEYYRRLSRREVVQVISYLRQHDNDYADMVILGYYTGLRLSDIANLELGEIDQHGEFLRLVPNKVRTRKPRPLTIPLVREAKEIVKVRCQTSDANGYLFPYRKRTRPSRMMSTAFKACGIEKENLGRASFHSLRATFISLMDEADIQPYITDAITGHASGSMHARYSQPAPKVLLKAVMRAIPSLFKEH